MIRLLAMAGAAAAAAGSDIRANGAPNRPQQPALHRHTKIEKEMKKKDDLFAEYDVVPYIMCDIHDITFGDLQHVVNQDGTEATYTLTHENASAMALHFAEWNLKNGCWARVIGPEGEDGGEEGEWFPMGPDANGRNRDRDIWSSHVIGSTIIVEVTCDGDGRNVKDDVRIVVDTYAACMEDDDGDFEGGEPIRHGRRAHVCGADDRENAVCFRDDNATEAEYYAARAVARLYIDGSWACTGFLVSTKKHLITNRHCVAKGGATMDDRALEVEAQFGAERWNCDAKNCKGCGVSNPGYVHCLKGSLKYKVANYKLDYVVLQINENECYDRDGNKITDPLKDLFGYIPAASNRMAQVGDRIYIPQHSKGRAKEMAVLSDVEAGDCEILRTNLTSCLSDYDEEIGYKCDAGGNSTGSPVILRGDLTAIGLHNCAGGKNCGNETGGYNRGVPFADICDHICNVLNRNFLCNQICS